MNEIVKYTERLKIEMNDGEIFFVDARHADEIQRLANDNKLVKIESEYRKGWDIKKMSVVEEIDGYDLLTPVQRSELDSRVALYKKNIDRAASPKIKAKWIQKLLDGKRI